MSEGLTAIYKFETRVTQSGDPNQSTDQLYAGLSGGFGSLTVGKFHNAAYLSGGIRDVGNAYGGGDVATKQGNTVSYGYSTETFTLQADAIMGSKDTGKAVDQAQFGLAVNIGDIGKVAIGYEKAEDTMKMGMDTTVMGRDFGGTDGSATLSVKDGEIAVDVNGIWRDEHNNVVKNDNVMIDTSGYVVVYHKGVGPVPGTVSTSDGTLTDNSRLYMRGGKYYAEECKDDQSGCSQTVIVKTDTSYPATPGQNPTAADANGVLHMSAAAVTITEGKIAGMEEVDEHGYKASHISASFGLGAVTARLGYSSKDSNDPDDKMKMKTTFLGFTGSIGDTGMDWRAFGRKEEGHDGKETNPWAIGVGKALGGGAYTYIEHGNEDDGTSGNTKIALHIDF